MHLHVLGICGTFMAGIARLAVELGHRVTGMDKMAYPPMSEQLAALGIDVQAAWDQPLGCEPDLVIVGNAATRGVPAVEQMLNEGRAYVSGPGWLREHVLRHRDVIAVAGTHGKTTTSSMLTWLLHDAGLEPGFLIGGVPGNFEVSAALGRGPFVLEADEYDTAFFDKRAKLLHYPATTFVLNNIEFDHADIYPDIAAIRRQFHHAIRTLPSRATILRAVPDAEIDATLDAGCWSQVVTFGAREDGAEWALGAATADQRQFEILRGGSVVATVDWDVPGAHNRRNALAAIAAAACSGVNPQDAARSLAGFHLPARRLEWRGDTAGRRLYLDFAHHPSAVKETLAALTAPGKRVLAVLELRSNTMRGGAHGSAVAEALAAAGPAWLLGNPDNASDYAEHGILIADDSENLAQELVQRSCPNDIIVLMSNGDLTGLADRIQALLRQEPEPAGHSHS
ncbi:MAG: UDP-N-acetylmuramate:L-alanyl-gamma-D-glutamyl-meso-diaminopimelate ligase [Pseudomonadota bacterium]